VPETYIVTPFASALPTVLHILRQELITHSALIRPTGPTPRPKISSTSKTIVFFPTARHVCLAAASLSKEDVSQKNERLFRGSKEVSESASTRRRFTPHKIQRQQRLFQPFHLFSRSIQDKAYGCCRRLQKRDVGHIAQLRRSRKRNGFPWVRFVYLPPLWCSIDKG
jgi:hypothetical protein